MLKQKKNVLNPNFWSVADNNTNTVSYIVVMWSNYFASFVNLIRFKIVTDIKSWKWKVIVSQLHCGIYIKHKLFTCSRLR